MTSTETRPKKVYWDPAIVLELENPDRNCLTCVGYAPTAGRRCQNPINRNNQALANELIKTISQTNISEAYPTDMLHQLARLCLCLRWHQCQIGRVVEDWCEKIDQHLASGSKVEPSPSESIQNDDRKSSSKEDDNQSSGEEDDSEPSSEDDNGEYDTETENSECNTEDDDGGDVDEQEEEKQVVKDEVVGDDDGENKQEKVLAERMRKGWDELWQVHIGQCKGVMPSKFSIPLKSRLCREHDY